MHNYRLEQVVPALAPGDRYQTPVFIRISIFSFFFQYTFSTPPTRGNLHAIC